MASSSGGAADRIVRKAGEGYDKPNADQELPIDINYQKLAEWLAVRQKLPADWHKRLQAIQAKVSEAVKELPAGVLAQVAGSGEVPVDYFRAVQIRDKLAETGERSLFGGLTGQAGIWDKIVKAYENGGVFVGEAAQTMVQNVDYEVPYLRKQMAKCSQQMADAERRQGEYVRSAAQCAANYKKECEQLGIAGTAEVKQELKQLSAQLPAVFEQIVQELRSPKLEAVINYYQHFTQYAHSSNADKAAAAAAAAAQQQQQGGNNELPDVLPVLTEVREGKTAPWQGSAAADAANNAAAAAPAIDWGMDVGSAGADGAAAAAGGVDWGISAADTSADAAGGISWDLGDLTASAGGATTDAAGESAGEGGGISWDVTVEPEAEGVAGGDAAAADASAGPSLNWDIDLSGIDMDASGTAEAVGAGGIDWGIDTPVAAGAAAVPGSGNSGAAGVSAGASSEASAARLQLDSEYRSQLLDDLQELRAFLLSRKAGLTGSSSSQDLLRALAPDVVASTDARDVGQMLLLVEKLLGELNADKLRQLLMISSSARYVDRLSSNLHRKAGQEAKMLAAAAETQARQQESRAMLASLQPKLSEIVSRTRTIKAAVEAAVSKQFAGRRVNVLGEINNALAASA